MANANSGMGAGTPQGTPSGQSDENVVSQPETRVVAGAEGTERAPSGHGAGYKDPQAKTAPAPVKGAHGHGDETSARFADTSREKEAGAPKDKSATPAEILGNIQADQKARADEAAAREAAKNA